MKMKDEHTPLAGLSPPTSCLEPPQFVIVTKTVIATQLGLPNLCHGLFTQGQKTADALRLHQNLNKPTNKPLEVVRKRSEVTMRVERCVR